MSGKLYPLKFEPLYKDRIWGGTKIKTELNKKYDSSVQCGESWEISCLPEDQSIVKNGFLAGNELEEIIEIYMGDLVGDQVFDKFGSLFPLLIKFIDARDALSIQVHPNDELAEQRHECFGKSELWYIIEAEKGATIVSGFKGEITKEEYLSKLEEQKLEDIVNRIPVKEDEVYFIPAGRIHAIMEGVLLAEIQQVSDITYRIYDWNRVDKEGKHRLLHTELAVDAIDFTKVEDAKTEYTPKVNETVKLLNCRYFETNVLDFNRVLEKDYIELDSFVIYICISGKFKINYDDNEYQEVVMGDCILLPAIYKNIKLIPDSKAKVLEVYIK